MISLKYLISEQKHAFNPFGKPTCPDSPAKTSRKASIARSITQTLWVSKDSMLGIRASLHWEWQHNTRVLLVQLGLEYQTLFQRICYIEFLSWKHLADVYGQWVAGGSCLFFEVSPRVPFNPDYPSIVYQFTNVFTDSQLFLSCFNLRKLYLLFRLLKYAVIFPIIVTISSTHTLIPINIKFLHPEWFFLYKYCLCIFSIDSPPFLSDK